MWTTEDNSPQMLCITHAKTRIYSELSTHTHIMIQPLIRASNKLWLTLIYQQVPHAKLINQHNIVQKLEYVHNLLN